LIKPNILDGKQLIYETLKSWETGESKFNEKKFNTWMKEGHIFYLNPEGIDTLLKSEASNIKNDKISKNYYSSADIYVNIAKEKEEPILLKRSSAYSYDSKSSDELRHKGLLFNNISAVF